MSDSNGEESTEVLLKFDPSVPDEVVRAYLEIILEEARSRGIPVLPPEGVPPELEIQVSFDPSVPANIAIMFVYFCAIFPNSPKGTVDASDLSVLLGVTVLGAVTIGGLLPVFVHRIFFHRRGGNDNE